MSGFGLSSTSMELVKLPPTSMELVKLPSTSMELVKPSLDNSMMEMPATSVERHGFPSRHCDVIPESEEMDTDSSDCDHEEEIVVVEEEEEVEFDKDKVKEEQLLGELRQEVLSCYSQLRNMGSLLRARERGRTVDGESLDTSSSSGSSSVTSQALRVRLKSLTSDQGVIAIF